jgi:hypothetical protein
MNDFTAGHPFLETYLGFIENTETPRLLHIWAALSGISACMGRRCWLPFGTGNILPNEYVILCGPAGLRKSTALNIVGKILRENTHVRFAPDDTGGQRQGFISAIADAFKDTDNENDKEIISRLTKISTGSEAARSEVNLSDLDCVISELENLHIDARDPNTLYVHASEFNSVLGEGNTQLMTFFQKMYDGDPYTYKLKTVTQELREALVGILGATTPAQIALSMPAEAVGQGFTSRCVFVYADQKHSRKIARPSLNYKLEEDLNATYSFVFSQLNGPFFETPRAAKLLDEFYMRGVTIQDPRFVHYSERRHTHLQKLCMAMAASRRTSSIEEIDVRAADQLLLYTEQFMPDALGEYGMNKLGAAKQRLLDMLKSTSEPIPTTALYGMLSRDMTQLEFKTILLEFHNAGRATVVTLPNLGQCVMATADTGGKKARKDLDTITRLLQPKSKIG